MQLGTDGQLGSIEAGKKADLIVLRRNLFDVPAHEIHQVGVLMTLPLQKFYPYGVEFHEVLI